jgi:flagellar motor switch protein FliM
MADEVDSDKRSAGPAPTEVGRWPLPWTAATVALRDVLEPALAVALRSRLPVEPAVHMVDLSLSSPSSFHRNVQEPTCCYALAAGVVRTANDKAVKVPEEVVWVDVATEIAYPILDLLLGGSGGRTQVTDHPLTAVERRLLRCLPEAAAECLSAALEPTGLSVKLSAGPAPAAALPAGPQEAAVLTFRLTCRGANGTMRICLPAALLEAMLPHAAAQGGPWAALELSAALPDTALPASELSGLAADDILTTDVPPDGDVTVRLAGVAKFAARLGACHGHRAITITKPLPPPKQD